MCDIPHTEKALDKIQHVFILITLNKLGIERNYLNIIKAYIKKHISNIIMVRDKTFAPKRE